MAQETVGIRELKSRLGSYMRQVKGGATVVITERGKPVGRIIPVKPSASVHARSRELIQSGLVVWSGHKLSRKAIKARPRGRRTVADLLLENRE